MERHQHQHGEDNSSEASTGISTLTTSMAGSPYRRRFDGTTRREAWEQLMIQKKSSPPKMSKHRFPSSSPAKSDTHDDPSAPNTTLSTSVESLPATTDEIDDPPDCKRTLPQHHIMMQKNKDLYYYRVVFRGVIALVSQPDSHSPKTGAYVSYGEVICSQHEIDVEELESMASNPVLRARPEEEHRDHNFLGYSLTDSPPQSVMSNGGNGAGSDVSSLDTMKTASSGGAAIRIVYHPPPRQRVSKKAIRVDRVLTGGYAMDAASEVTASTSNILEHPTPSFATPRRSDVLLPMVGPTPLPSAEHSLSTVGCFNSNNMEEQSPLSSELGYILSTRKNVLLVEQIQEPPFIESGKFLYQVVSATPIPIFAGPCMDAPRTQAVLVPGTIHEVCLRLSNDDSITFLRLSHRRGWISNRKVAMTNNHGGPGSMKIGSVPAVKEIMSSGGDSTSMTTSSVTPGSIIRRRHRPPRRKRELNQDTFMTPRKQPQQAQQQDHNRIVSPLPEQHAMTPASNTNISILSEDDDFTASSNMQSKVMTPERSIARSQVVHATEARHSYFLIRVNAPRGLQILDAPQFQVSNLIHGTAHTSSTTSVRDGSIFSTMANPNTAKSTPKIGNPAIFDSIKKQRILPGGAIFEASRRMETSASFGSGLIKLSDNSGWAIVPGKEELDLQCRHYHGGAANVKEGEATRAYEEVGNAMINTDNEADCIWVRVVSRQGVSVECSPPVVPLLPNRPDGRDVSPTSSAGGSSSTGASNFGVLASNDSDVASSVGSAFLDAMFRTPNKKAAEYPGSTRKPPHPFYSSTDPTTSGSNSHSLLSCGMFFQINKWDDFELQGGAPAVAQDYVRLRGGQGWVPRSVIGKPVIERIGKPETRLGSFWFRVLHPRGIKVRLGPSRKATSIKSEKDVYFRFECGEFLRASEVVTFFPEKSAPESFAKLYRNRHVRQHNMQTDCRQLQSMTTPAEWVQVVAEDYAYLDICVTEPLIQRHRGGWRYNSISDTGVSVRKGPSYAAETTGVHLLAGESVLITERVTPPGEQMAWLRLQDGKGWVHDTGENDEVVMLAHSLRDRNIALNRPDKSERREKEEVAYNTLIARLFPHSEEDPRSVQ